MAVKKAGCGGSFDGLCCRMVLETKRVFDGCAYQESDTTLALTSEQPIPQGAEFVSARVKSSELVNYSITECDGSFHISGEIVTTFAVTYEAGALYTVNASYREQRDFFLKLPSATLIPYTIEVNTYMSVGRGAIVGQNTVSVSGCLLRIIKVTAPVDVLVPTYGYCSYPPCEGCECSAIEQGRIFPRGRDE